MILRKNDDLFDRDRTTSSTLLKSESGNGIVVALSGTLGGGGFAESNRMLEVLGVKFDRGLQTIGGDVNSVATAGDLHLSKLDEVMAA